MLSFVPADDRDTWLRMGMAVKKALGEAGFGVWDEWAQGSAKHRPADARSVWRSIDPDGGIGVGTLIREARLHGYTGTPHRSATVPFNTSSTARPTSDAYERQERAQKAAQKAADSIWTGARWNKQVHSYWARKGFPELLWPVSKSARVIGGLPLAGCLVIPVHDIADQLVTLQFIAGNGDRRFLPGGRTCGGMFMLGQLEHAPVVLICEGAATGMSLYTAAGYPVAAALSAGNLLKVSTALKSALPDAQLLICADTDGDGLRAAERSAAAAGARIVTPTFTTPQEPGADFNDLHHQDGLPAVAAAVQAVLHNPS